MLGRHHLFISVFSLSVVLIPFFEFFPDIVLPALIGCAIGSLIPDADAEERTIFRRQTGGVKGDSGNIVNPIGLIFPLFRYTARSCIIKPVSFLFNIDVGHRGFFHTVNGVVLTAAFTTLYCVIFLFTFTQSLFLILFLSIVFVISFIIGGLLHLVEDGMTKKGVRPLKRKISGKLIKSAESSFQDLFVVALLIFNVIAYLWIWWVGLLLLLIGWFELIRKADMSISS